jgi:hypothetical protein
MLVSAAGEFATARNIVGTVPNAPWTWSSRSLTSPVANSRSTSGTAGATGAVSVVADADAEVEAKVEADVEADMTVLLQR